MAALSLLLTSVTQLKLLSSENAKIDSSILILSNGISPTHEDKSDLQKTNFSNFSNFSNTSLQSNHSFTGNHSDTSNLLFTGRPFNENVDHSVTRRNVYDERLVQKPNPFFYKDKIWRFCHGNETINHISKIVQADCELLGKREGSTPVIFFSLGRSGSSITWMTMANLTRAFTGACETTGGNPKESRRFFDGLENNKHIDKTWASKLLCDIQHRVIDEAGLTNGIVGFQWKGFMHSIMRNFSLDTLREVGSHSNPKIKVVYLVRNYIDHIISKQKHLAMKENSIKLAHCRPEDNECLKKHESYGKLNLSPSDLMSKLEKFAHTEKATEALFRKAKIKYIKVSYEKLYNDGHDASEWMDIFRYLERGPQEGLTMDDVRATFEYTKTSKQSHREILSNIEEIKTYLKNTTFSSLLRD